MTQYINYVKVVYQQNMVEKDLNAVKWPPTPSTLYINLVCVECTTDFSKQDADECTRAMVEDGSVDVILKKKKPIDFSDIAKSVPADKEKDKRRIILVEGAPGVGKSTFSWEFCRRWESGEIAQQYQLVLLLRLRDQRMSKAQSLADLIYHPLKDVCQVVERDLVSTHGANTLIILEGFDELPSTCRTQSSVFLQLISGQLLPLATVLVTSRPWATQVIHREYSHRILQHIEILGFTGKQIEEYVTSVFMDERKPANDRASVECISDVISYIGRYPQIRACMYVPLNSAIVVSVYQESKAGRCILPKTLTELYTALLQTLLLRYLYGHPQYGQSWWKIQSLKEDLPPDVYSKLLAISELAYSGICTDQGNSVKLIYSNLPPDFETLGLMQSVPQLYVTQGEVMSYNFLHLTVQEFLAALHISNMSPEEQLEHFQKEEKERELIFQRLQEGSMLEPFSTYKHQNRMQIVLRFLAGLTKLAKLSPGNLRDLLLKKPNKDQIIERDKYSITADVMLSIQQVNWMFEAQRDDLVPLEKTVEFKSHEKLTSLDYYSLGHCLVHTYCKWVLTIRNVIAEEEVKMLVAGANTKHDTAARVVRLSMGVRRISSGDSPSIYQSEEDSRSTYQSEEDSTSSDKREEVDGNFLHAMSGESLNVLFTGLQNMSHLQELHLVIPFKCCSITWPRLSGLRVLHLVLEICTFCIFGGDEMRGGMCRLDTLLPNLSLESLTIECCGGLSPENIAAIGELLLSSNCPKHVDIKDVQCCAIAEVARDHPVHEQCLGNKVSLVQEKNCCESIRFCLDYSIRFCLDYYFAWTTNYSPQPFPLGFNN